VNFLLRAWLYVSRKRGKSLLLFLIFLLVATLALTGISVKTASGKATAELRKSLGGGFVVTQNTSDQSKYVQKDMGNGTTATQYQGEMLTRSIAEKIAKVPGVKYYNAEVDGPAELKNTNGDYLTLKGIQGSYFANDDSMNHQCNIYGYTETKYTDLFTGGSLTLTEGRHITSNDKNTVMIHKELAEKNHLKLGDKIVVTMSPTITGGNANAKNLKEEVTIVGIFDSKADQQVSTYGLPGELLQNSVVMDADTALKLYTWSSSGYDKVHYTVNDPSQLESIVDQAKQLKTVDWNSFNIALDDTTYQAAAESLKNMNKLIVILIVVIVIICVAVLSLLLTMWTKSRIRESGILLSIGIGKAKIILQHITEVAMIAVLAFGISYFSSAVVAQRIGGAMLNAYSSKGSTSNTTGGQNTGGGFVYNALPQTQADTSQLVKLDVNVDPASLLWIFGIGGAMVVASVLASSIQILRVKPKELLTKMS
jgi:putative ABC transport system permease protein